MNPRVEEYLAKCEEAKREKEARQKEAEQRQAARQKEAEQRQAARHREEVLLRAGLYGEEKEECSKDEYFQADPSVRAGTIRKDDFTLGYYLKKRTFVDVTDEEFAAIEKTLEEESESDPKESVPKAAAQETPPAPSGNENRAGDDPRASSPVPEEKSTAATFFTVLAWILWIGGLIASIALANVVTGYDYRGNARTAFSFSAFLTNFVIYLISGGFCYAASELFKKLTTIVNLLRQK